MFWKLASNSAGKCIFIFVEMKVGCRLRPSLEFVCFQFIKRNIEMWKLTWIVVLQRTKGFSRTRDLAKYTTSLNMAEDACWFRLVIGSMMEPKAPKSKWLFHAKILICCYNRALKWSFFRCRKRISPLGNTSRRRWTYATIFANYGMHPWPSWYITSKAMLANWGSRNVPDNYN